MEKDRKYRFKKWEKQIYQKDNEIKRSRAHFVSTIPSTRQEMREISIQENIEKMIENSEDIIGISTLRIDIIHEKLIDKIEISDIDVKILTSVSGANGD